MDCICSNCDKFLGITLDSIDAEYSTIQLKIGNIFVTRLLCEECTVIIENYADKQIKNIVEDIKYELDLNNDRE